MISGSGILRIAFSNEMTQLPAFKGSGRLLTDKEGIALLN